MLNAPPHKGHLDECPHLFFDAHFPLGACCCLSPAQVAEFARRQQADKDRHRRVA